MRGIITTVVAMSAFVSMVVAPLSVIANPITPKVLPKGLTVAVGDPNTLLVGSENEGIKTYLFNRGVLKADTYQLLYKNENRFYYGIAGDVQVGVTTLQQLGLADGTTTLFDSVPLIIFDMTTHRMVKADRNAGNTSSATDEYSDHIGSNKSSSSENASKNTSKSKSKNTSDIENNTKSSEQKKVTAKSFAEYLASQVNANPLMYRTIVPFTYNGSSKSYDGVVEFNTSRDQFYYSERIHMRIYEDPYYGISVRFVMIPKEDDAVLWPKTEFLLSLNR